MQQHPAAQLVFVDESSTHVAMTPLYARTPRGKRAYGAVPRNKGANITLLAALTRQGMTAAMTVPGAVDSLVFERYIEHVLLPALSPGQTVVMDNLSVHKRARVAQLLHDHGCTLRFLPTYSPDLAPIEGGFSKVKTLVRRDQPRTREASQRFYHVFAIFMEVVDPKVIAAIHDNEVFPGCCFVVHFLNVRSANVACYIDKELGVWNFCMALSCIDTAA